MIITFADGSTATVLECSISEENVLHVLADLDDLSVDDAVNVFKDETKTTSITTDSGDAYNGFTILNNVSIDYEANSMRILMQYAGDESKISALENNLSALEASTIESIDELASVIDSILGIDEEETDDE